jgi:hypothetical protein
MLAHLLRNASLKFLGAMLAAAIINLAAAPSATAAYGINTISSWDGMEFISPFGVVDTATYGQSITVSAGMSPLNSFTFKIGNCDAAVTFRGHIYAWDGAKATGSSLYNSPAQTLAASSSFSTITFTPASPINLSPGQYVLFASTSQDQTGAPTSGCQWGALSGNTTYAGGQFVYQNNGPNTGQWTSSSWDIDFAQDLAFAVDGLNPVPPNPVPILSEWNLLLLAGVLAIGGLIVLRRRA